MSLNKFIHDFEETPLHSTSLGQASNDNSIGASAPQTFSQRRNIEKNRNKVRTYKDSLIVHNHHHDRTLQRNLPSVPQHQDGEFGASDKTPANRAANTYRGGQVQRSSMLIVRPNFSEPPTRNFNPYK